MKAMQATVSAPAAAPAGKTDKKRASRRRKHRAPGAFFVIKTIMFIVFALYAFTLLYALVFALSISFKDQWMYPGANQVGWPDPWVWTNYTEAWLNLETAHTGMIGMFFNSLWYAGGGAFLGVAVSSMVAYVVAKYRFPGGKFLYGLAIFTMTLPIVDAFP